MRDKAFFYFLIVLLFFCFYKAHDTSKDNERLNKICVDQEEVIQLQNHAIEAQSIYILELERISHPSRAHYVH